MSDVEIRGTEQLQSLSKALKAAGRTELRKELHSGLKKSARPLIVEARKSAKDVFPHRGGLNVWVAKNTKFTVQLRTGSNPGLRIGAPRKNVTAFLTNRDGRFRHPVHADPALTRKQWAWVSQKGMRGWFDDSMRRNAPQIRPEMQAAVNRVLNQITKGAR